MYHVIPPVTVPPAMKGPAGIDLSEILLPSSSIKWNSILHDHAHVDDVTPSLFVFVRCALELAATAVFLFSICLFLVDAPALFSFLLLAPPNVLCPSFLLLLLLLLLVFFYIHSPLLSPLVSLHSIQTIPPTAEEC